MESTPGIVIFHDMPQYFGEEDVRKLFSSFGIILSIRMFAQTISFNLPGGSHVVEELEEFSTELPSAVIVFDSMQSAFRAYHTLHNATIFGSRLSLSQPKPVVPASKLYSESAQHFGREVLDHPPSPHPAASTTLAAASLDSASWAARSRSGSNSQAAAACSASSTPIFSTNDCFPGLNLPPLKDALRSCNISNSPNFVQVLVSFISKKGETVVCTDLLHTIFSSLGKILDVQLKRNELDPLNNLQKGYGFVHFELTWSGIYAALQASHTFQRSSVLGVMLDCKVCTLLENFLEILKARLDVDLLAYFGQQQQQQHTKRKTSPVARPAVSPESLRSGYRIPVTPFEGEMFHPMGPSSIVDASHAAFLESGMGTLPLPPPPPSTAMSSVGWADSQFLYPSPHHSGFSAGRPLGYVPYPLDIDENGLSRSVHGRRPVLSVDSPRYIAGGGEILQERSSMDEPRQAQSMYITTSSDLAPSLPHPESHHASRSRLYLSPYSSLPPSSPSSSPHPCPHPLPPTSNGIGVHYLPSS